MQLGQVTVLYWPFYSNNGPEVINVTMGRSTTLEFIQKNKLHLQMEQYNIKQFSIYFSLIETTTSTSSIKYINFLRKTQLILFWHHF